MMSPEVAAVAAEPPEVVALIAVFPEVMVPAAVSPEVVAPSNVLSARHVTVEEPPEVAPSAAELPEVSVVCSHLHIACPFSAMEAACELLSCSEPTMEASYELSDLSTCPVSVSMPELLSARETTD